MNRQPTTHNPQPKTGYRGYDYLSLFVIHLVVVTALLAHCPLPTAHAQTFTRNLSIGSRGDDVRALQILLNQQQQTQVAYSGVGSPGQETDYFGQKTHAAVVKYQDMYATDVLIPAGLTKGTGFVGPLTRQKLQGVSGAVATVVKPILTSIEPQQGGVGTIVTLRGSGFTPTNNKVSSIFEEFDGIPSLDGTSMQITIQGPFPQMFLSQNKEFYKENNFEMDYQLVVSNNNGASGFIPFRFTFY